jgi:hypothetical protein
LIKAISILIRNIVEGVKIFLYNEGAFCQCYGTQLRLTPSDKEVRKRLYNKEE